MTFEKGQSGNPAGRPPGSRNKATILAEAMFQGEAEGIIRMVLDKAREGDMTSRTNPFAFVEVHDQRLPLPNLG
jgi:hypothetical protein